MKDLKRVIRVNEIKELNSFRLRNFRITSFELTGLLLESRDFGVLALKLLIQAKNLRL